MERRRLTPQVERLLFALVCFEIKDEDEAAGDEGQEVAGLRRFGASKDHRPELPQVVVGLAVTREGIPVRCWVFPGNSSASC